MVIARRLSSALLLAVLILLASTAAAPLGAEEPPPSLPVAEAEDFLGDWKVTVDFQGQKLEMGMRVLDEEGLVAAMVASPQGTQRITKILRTEDGLDMAFESPIGSIHLALSLAGDELQGKLATESGGFEAALRGVRGTVDIDELAQGGLFGSPPPESRLELASGEVRVRMPEDERAMAELQPVRGDEAGQLLILPDSAALKLRTDVDLSFGEVVISGSLGEGYPGVYSLWIVERDEDWRLLVNREADIWGTQHQPEHDLAEIALERQTLAESQEALSVDLEPTETGGLIRVRWRAHEWTAEFTAAEP